MIGKSEASAEEMRIAESSQMGSRREQFMNSRSTVFFVHIKGWTPSATDHWRGPYQSVSTASAQATRSTRYSGSGNPYGDWTAKIYRLDGDSLTLVEV